jgi:broad specificity phosphatase PhoE
LLPLSLFRRIALHDHIRPAMNPRARSLGVGWCMDGHTACRRRTGVNIAKLEPSPKPAIITSQMAMELLLIRHGQSEGNVGKSTDPDCLLTDIGLAQARQLGSRLAGQDLGGFLCLTSPYRRAMHTAAEIAKETGLSFAVEERIREWGDVATVGGKQYHKESVHELIARLEDFLRHYDGRNLVVVSHAAPIAVLTQLAWGEPPNTEGPFWAGVGNCCLRRLMVTYR